MINWMTSLSFLRWKSYNLCREFEFNSHACMHKISWGIWKSCSFLWMIIIVLWHYCFIVHSWLECLVCPLQRKNNDWVTSIKCLYCSFNPPVNTSIFIVLILPKNRLVPSGFIVWLYHFSVMQTCKMSYEIHCSVKPCNFLSFSQSTLFVVIKYYTRIILSSAGVF